MQSQLEWSIHNSFFQQLQQSWGPHNIDLFASPTNTKLPAFMTWKPHPMAVNYNALHRPWTTLGSLYICPPWNLIPQILQKLRLEKLHATIVTPGWPSAIWYPTLLSMSTTDPIHVPRKAVLPPPNEAPNVLEKNPHWTQSGLSDDATQTILDSPQAIRRHGTYAPAQQVLLDWAERQGIDPHIPDPIALVNYLAHQRRERAWKPATVLAKRSAILDLFHNRSIIIDNPCTRISSPP